VGLEAITFDDIPGDEGNLKIKFDLKLAQVNPSFKALNLKP
jgi:hypothetical protein